MPDPPMDFAVPPDAADFVAKLQQGEVAHAESPVGANQVGAVGENWGGVLEQIHTGKIIAVDCRVTFYYLEHSPQKQERRFIAGAQGKHRTRYWDWVVPFDESMLLLWRRGESFFARKLSQDEEFALNRLAGWFDIPKPTVYTF